MYDTTTRLAALRLLDGGRSLNSVSKETGISRAAMRSWRVRVEPARPTGCVRCTGVPTAPEPGRDYAYLLGLYLGDGCLSGYAKGVYGLRIACGDVWPGLMDECEAAMRAIRPGSNVFRTPRQGCHMVTSLWKHWPCLFPQHGPGRKHERAIVLESWQRDIVRGEPWALVRGLIHSDGCRITNWTTRVVAGERKRYEYPRYLFTNESADIMRIMTTTLDELGVEWKFARRNNLSVARRTSVALMDEHVGPKY
ncbi:transcriptional regulator [Embleya sp. NPDC059237]|uniref:transcriptional regulator n=1 Tax=Embleya sp. NPDC059237 TaxID=3346784 RepID=UPI0036AA89E2